MPSPFELLAVELEDQMAFPITLVGIAHRMPMAAIPDHDGPAAVLALGNRALERVVFDRVILDVDCQALVARNQARPAGHGPALHHAVKLESKVVVQPTGGMLLDDIPAALAVLRASARLGCHTEITLLLVDLKTHAQLPLLRPLRLPAAHPAVIASPLPRADRADPPPGCNK